MASSEGTADAHELTRALEDAIASLQQIKTQIRETEDLPAQDGLFKLLCAFRDSLAPYHMSLRHSRDASVELPLEQQLRTHKDRLQYIVHLHREYDGQGVGNTSNEQDQLRKEIRALKKKQKEKEDEAINHAQRELDAAQATLNRLSKASNGVDHTITHQIHHRLGLENGLADHPNPSTPVQTAFQNVNLAKQALKHAQSVQQRRMAADDAEANREADEYEKRSNEDRAERERLKAIREYHHSQPRLNLRPTEAEERWAAKYSGVPYRERPGVTSYGPLH
jgi:hypothetical protein